MSATKTKMTFIPYKGGGEVMKDLLAGQIDVYCEPATGTTANIQAGKIKPYAVTTKRRVATLPDVPTTAEAGFPEIGITTWYGLYAPKGTPAAAIDKLASRPAGRAEGQQRRHAVRPAQHGAGAAGPGNACRPGREAPIGSEVLVGSSQGSRGTAGIAWRLRSSAGIADFKGRQICRHLGRENRQFQTSLFLPLRRTSVRRSCRDGETRA